VEPLSATIEALLAPVLRAGLRWQLAGLEHIPERGPVLLAANHISFLDPPCLAYVAHLRDRRVRFLAMAELFESPVPRFLLRNLGHIPVPRKSGGARASLTAALTSLGWGECVGIFPEGGISRDLEPRPGQTGAARLAAWSGAPVVPVGLWGTHRLAFPGRRSHHRLGVVVAASVGAPLVVSEDGDVREATDRIMAAICAEVAQARVLYPQTPGPDQDWWWVRGPESARLRSCREQGGPEEAGALDPPLQTFVETAVAERATPSEPAAVALWPVGFGRLTGEDRGVASGGVVLDQQLRAVPFFRNLPGPALEAVAAHLRPEDHERGSVVFREGEPGETMYLVASGQVDVVAGAAQSPLASLGPGSVVGELALLLGEPRSATLRVVVDSCLWALRRSDLDALLAEHPSIGIELSRELGRRLVATNRLLVAPATTRFSAVWGDGAERLAGALQALVGIGPVGVMVLAGGPAARRLPDGVTLIERDLLDPETLTGFAGTEVEGHAHVLLVLPPAETALSRAAVNLAEHVVSFAPAPAWVARSGTAYRVLRCDGSSESLARAARWVSGRAVGLALSSGSSKALAHLGVLKVLREAGVTIDAVAGTSGGALVAAGLAFGMSDEVLLSHGRALASSLQFRRFDFNLLPRAALFKGVRLRHQLDEWFEGRRFSETIIPCWVVATDVAGGAEVVIDSGPVADGVRASMSLPGVMNPWPVSGRMCIDGAVVNPMPASVLRDAGLRIVIGSNVAGQELPTQNLAGTPHLLQIMSRMVNSMEREMIKAQVPLVDVLIRPVIGVASSFDFSRIDEFVAEGERAAREQLDEIKAALAAAAG
jgi:1-acyl-sn-glycerol-3-phosphate acyltransferase